MQYLSRASAVLLVTLISGCASQWKCIADINRNNKCSVIDCSNASQLLDQGGYRSMKIYPSRTTVIYSTDPLTDITTCNREAKQ